MDILDSDSIENLNVSEVLAYDAVYPDYVSSLLNQTPVTVITFLLEEQIVVPGFEESEIELKRQVDVITVIGSFEDPITRSTLDYPAYRHFHWDNSKLVRLIVYLDANEIRRLLQGARLVVRLAQTTGKNDRPDRYLLPLEIEITDELGSTAYDLVETPIRRSIIDQVESFILPGTLRGPDILIKAATVEIPNPLQSSFDYFRGLDE